MHEVRSFVPRIEPRRATAGHERDEIGESSCETRDVGAMLTFPAWTGLVKDLAFDASGRWLAFAGADSDLPLWDLTLLHEGLAGRGTGLGSAPAQGRPCSRIRTRGLATLVCRAGRRARDDSPGRIRAASPDL